MTGLLSGEGARVMGARGSTRAILDRPLGCEGHDVTMGRMGPTLRW